MIPYLEINTKNESNKVLFISFDAVAISGITVESTKLAKYLNSHGYESFIDLGYDIKIDKGNFGRDYTYAEEKLFSKNFHLIRNFEASEVASYQPDFINKAHNMLINESLLSSKEEKEQMYKTILNLAEQIANKLVENWERLNINYLIVENGTLPDNIIYTHALYGAIERYGKQRQLQHYVLWRDHDLMWNSERLSNKYGTAPWTYAVKPVQSPYIHYVTLNQSLATKLKEWCENRVDIGILRNTYSFNETKKVKDVRRFLGIGKEELIIARTTRIIPEKRLDRDLYLIKKLKDIMMEKEKKVHLVIAGDRNENVQYNSFLNDYIMDNGLTELVHFMGILSHDFIEPDFEKFTIQDLYNNCDIVSFLTSYDYDSYGNPIGEAISHKKCYLTTSYEFYNDVYGQYGFQGEVMPIFETKDEMPEDDFISNVYNLLFDSEVRYKIAEKNYEIGQRLLSNSILKRIFKL